MRFFYIITLSILSIQSSGQNINKIIISKTDWHEIKPIQHDTFLGNFYKDCAFLENKRNDFVRTYTNLYSQFNHPKTGFSYCWDINGEKVYCLDAVDSENSFCSIFKFDIVKNDTSLILKKEKNFHDSLKQVYKTDSLYKNYLYEYYYPQKSRKKNSRSVISISKLGKVLNGKNNDYSLSYGAICYDFIVLDSTNMEFYIRDKKQLTRWHYRYPPTYLDKQAPDAWTETITYSADTLGSYPYLEENLWIMNLEDGWQTNKNAHRVYNKWKRVEPTQTDNPYLPSGKKHKYQSIVDSAFFVGQFKVIKQGSNRYFINTQHGAIYTLSSDSLVRIGQIEMDNYLPLNDKNIFVEDRDNNELIFFAPVNWGNSNLPKPQIKVMNKKQMRKNYDYLME